ncbi:MAG TPA: NAD(P)/FAD-dependent oxidoreductase [Aldersonia sp.]
MTAATGVRVAVIGCGIGGATAALALAKIGASVDVYEAAARSAYQSGWVTLGPAAMTALAQVGVAARIEAAGFPVTSVRFVDTETGREFGFTRNEATHRWPSTHVWRRDLLRTLRDQLDMVGVRCRYGTTVTPDEPAADLIVGADGARSATRTTIGNASELSYTGETIRFGHHPRPVPGFPVGVLMFWTHASGMAGCVSDDREGSFWCSRHRDSPVGTLDDATALAPLRSTPVTQVIDASWIGDPIALYESAPEGIWHDDRTVLVGDAAHPLSATGFGATLAIEDGIVLARCIRDADSLAAALTTFTDTRRPVARACFRPAQGRLTTIAADQLELRRATDRPVGCVSHSLTRPA